MLWRLTVLTILIPLQRFSFCFQQRSFHLISLPPTKDVTGKIVSSTQAIRELWRWKDAVLGDGRDFFVHRPRAISDLTSLIIGATFTNATQEWVIDECAILSNCARMDVYLSCCPSKNQTSEACFSSPTFIVANVLAIQLEHYRAAPKSPSHILKSQVSQLMDLPGMVVVEPNSFSAYTTKLQHEIEQQLVHINDTTDIVRHACLITAGLVRRSGHGIRFRPFSSRDAHIMLQMKRCLDLAVGSNISTILKASLTAGKAARNVNVVPEIKLLQGQFGEPTKIVLKAAIEVSSGFYSEQVKCKCVSLSQPLLSPFHQATIQKALEPNIHRCVHVIVAHDSNIVNRINALRDKCRIKVSSSGGDWEGKEGQLVRKILHPSIMQVRSGQVINEEEVLIRVGLYLADLQNHDSQAFTILHR